MDKPTAREICILIIIYKHPKTGQYMPVVECGSRNCFENSIKALEARNIEIVFKFCESESALFEEGITLYQGFTSAEFLVGVCATRMNTKSSTSTEKKSVPANVVEIQRKISYSSYFERKLSSLGAASL